MFDDASCNIEESGTKSLKYGVSEFKSGEFEILSKYNCILDECVSEKLKELDFDLKTIHVKDTTYDSKGNENVPHLQIMGFALNQDASIDKSFGYRKNNLHVVVARLSGFDGVFNKNGYYMDFAFDESGMFMQRANLPLPAQGYVVHHLNHDPMDNRKKNLIVVRPWLNSMMNKLSSNSVYKGVKKTSSGNFNIAIYLGSWGTKTRTFKKEEDAAIAYIHVLHDFLKLKGRLHCPVFSCIDSKWHFVDPIWISYVSDADYQEPRLDIFQRAYKTLGESNRNRIKIEEGKPVLTWCKTHIKENKIVLKKQV